MNEKEKNKQTQNYIYNYVEMIFFIRKRSAKVNFIKNGNREYGVQTGNIVMHSE